MKINGKIIKLPKAFKNKWIKALKSGKYKQGQYQLYKKGENKKKGTYCCLGVAGNICGISTRSLMRGVYQGDDAYIKKIKKAGLPDCLIGLANNKNVVGKLTKLNDLKNKSFEEIAAYIDKNL